MQFHTNFSVWFTAIISYHVAHCLVLPQPAADCSTFGTILKQGLGGLNTTITGTALIAANASSNVYEYCQVNGSVAYTSNNTLNFQVWLPDPEAYTGRFMAVGNGGMAGTIDTANMLLQLNMGFAVAGGDSGHLAANNNDGGGTPGVYLPYMHDPAQVEAWIHNAISIFTTSAKSIIQSYYGSPARYSYYDGCSTGGAQGFALAQLHPELFDGIYAGSPGNWYSHLALSFLWNAVKTRGSSINIPQEKLNAITTAVLEECDTLDGVKDNMLENPLKCNFDINIMACNSSSNMSTCLTPNQLEAAKLIYAGPTLTNGSALYPGFSVGSENVWSYQQGYLADAFSIPILQNLVFNDLSYNYTDFNWGSDVVALDQKVGQHIDEISTNLTAFKKRGGKLVVTQGWADPLNAAIWPIQHQQDLETFFGGDVSDFFNLFMVPGGGHCAASASYPASPGTYHVAQALIEWVERGEKPDYVLSTGKINGTGISRKLCPWPQTATYIGGEIGFESSYVCENS